MATRETDLPGVGTKHTMDLTTGEQLVAVEHRAGHWELAILDASGKTTSLASLQAKEASELGRILSKSEVRQEDPRKRMLLEEFGIEWVKLDDHSSLVGQTLQNSGIRARTGVSVIAILRPEGALVSPPPDTQFRAGDTLVVVGRQDHVEAFLATYSVLHGE